MCLCVCRIKVLFYPLYKKSYFAFYLKITVRYNNTFQVVYDSFCLPNGKEILVKPGTEISLTYVPL